MTNSEHRARVERALDRFAAQKPRPAYSKRLLRTASPRVVVDKIMADALLPIEEVPVDPRANDIKASNIFRAILKQGK